MVALIATLSACSAYQPGSLLNSHPDSAETVGCIDVAAESHFDAQAQGPVAKVIVANRCNTAVAIDFRTIQATVKYTDGHLGESKVYDPEFTIGPVTLDARSRGWEVFEYHPLDAADLSRLPGLLCLDVTYLDTRHPSPDARQVCVRAEN